MTNGITYRCSLDGKSGKVVHAFFCRLNQRDQHKKTIIKLLSSEGLHSLSPNQIIREKVQYFSHISSFKEQLTFPEDDGYQLMEIQKSSCEGLIADDELLM